MREVEDLAATLKRWGEEGREVAIATLVRVSGSSPRTPGARLLATRDGEFAGSITAGCVESDLVDRARRVLDDGRPAIASYGVSNEAGFDVGLTCGGTIDVLVEPYLSTDPWAHLFSALGDDRPAALCVALDPPRMLGRKLVVTGPDDVIGSIEPALDIELAAQAWAMLPTGGTRELTLKSGATEATIFVEAFGPPRRLYVVGATPVAAALTHFCSQLGFRVVVIDPRAGLATRERFPQADRLEAAWPEEALAGAVLDENSCVVALTHDQKFDVPTLACALRSEAGYIGALGSRRTRDKRAASLAEQGFRVEDLARVHAPIGLDIGGRTPAEIALAIAAEMLAVLSGRDAGALGALREPIHGRR